MKLADLHTLIAAACPIYGICSDGRIFYMPTATAAQKTQAQQIMSQNLPSVIV